MPFWEFKSDDEAHHKVAKLEVCRILDPPSLRFWWSYENIAFLEIYQSFCLNGTHPMHTENGGQKNDIGC